MVTNVPFNRAACRSRIFPWMSAVCAFCLCAASAFAHPVPKDNHDRTIVVRLQYGETPNRIRVRVEYRVEVDETTVYLNDMKAFKDEVNPLDYRNKALEYYAQFTRIYAPIYAERLIARVQGTPIADFRCVSRKQQLVDEEGKALGHLRCDFVFESAFELAAEGNTAFFFREQNYHFEPGQIILSLVNETGLNIVKKTEPDEALRKSTADWDDRLREITAVLAPRAQAAPPVQQATQPPSEPTSPPRETNQSHDDSFSLLRLILNPEYGFWLTLLLAFVFGAAHALTPGHGKTLVAAYLVGERGTVWHAVFLGLVTTLTHTGVVILIAVIMTVLPDDMQGTFQKWIKNGLGLVMGLIVACMGFWLLLQRLAGRADHIHLDGGHHHHHHHAVDDSAPSIRPVSWWGLVILGVTGGLVPCWDAIILLFYTVGTSRFWLVLPAVLAFSAGLAVVLVLVGVIVVQVPRFVQSRWGSGRLVQSLPIVSAILVTLMGLWLCYEGVHGGSGEW